MKLYISMLQRLSTWPFTRTIYPTWTMQSRTTSVLSSQCSAIGSLHPPSYIYSYRDGPQFRTISSTPPDIIPPAIPPLVARIALSPNAHSPPPGNIYRHRDLPPKSRLRSIASASPAVLQLVIFCAADGAHICVVQRKMVFEEAMMLHHHVLNIRVLQLMTSSGALQSASISLRVFGYRIVDTGKAWTLLPSLYTPST
ncbi:hypothetical protein HYPSUDRAFT_84380 [Hypholoma sublateritium FD-334 SS-4]|uniref:Uncharacterized protein n=1 Tax=Hypholoma sublateritium (strain FD-334 SS-4) TaxID=945553 RepID=A0A0D2MR58_HYPSF|nr:hypothetical protein HYPSUDRAFT_84380 [Hypholoma sublateritium FD-334 SS-4]